MSDFPHSEEGRGDDHRADAYEAFAGQCPALNDAGESCSFTARSLHKHSWEY